MGMSATGSQEARRLERPSGVTDKTDEQLLAEAVREGSDGPAFRALVTRHQDGVWRLCYRLMDNEHDAQDAAQEVFVRLFVHRAKFAGRSKFTTWLHGIAVRTCLTLRRGRGRRRKHESPVPDDQLERGTPAGSDAGDRLDLAKMLGEMDEEDRAMVILKYAEGYTFEELADLFEMTTSAVKMRVSRACDKVQKRYGDAQQP